MAEILNESTQFEGVVYKSVNRKIELDNGDIIKRDLILKNECVVGFVIHKTSRKIILVKEFRVGSMSTNLAFVAGMIDEGESPARAMVRETIEETGYNPTLINDVGYGYTSSGFTNEKIHYFYIEVDGEKNTQLLDNDESIEVVEVDGDELERLVVSNEIDSNHAHACMLRCSFIAVDEY